MANKTIQQLNAITTADASDVLAIYDVSANGTNKITVANLLNNARISGLTTTAETIPAAINELNTNLNNTVSKIGSFIQLWSGSITTNGSVTVPTRVFYLFHFFNVDGSSATNSIAIIPNFTGTSYFVIPYSNNTETIRLQATDSGLNKTFKIIALSNNAIYLKHISSFYIS